MAGGEQPLVFRSRGAGRVLADLVDFGGLDFRSALRAEGRDQLRAKPIGPPADVLEIPAAEPCELASSSAGTSPSRPSS